MIERGARRGVFRCAEILFEMPPLGDPVIDNNIWLKLTQIVIQIDSVLHAPPVCPVSIEPHHFCIILGDQFLQLGFHIVYILSFIFLAFDFRELDRALCTLGGMMPIDV